MDQATRIGGFGKSSDDGVERRRIIYGIRSVGRLLTLVYLRRVGTQHRTALTPPHGLHCGEWEVVEPDPHLTRASDL